MKTIKNVFYVLVALAIIGLIAGFLALVTVASGMLTLLAIGIGLVWFLYWIVKSWFESK